MVASERGGFLTIVEQRAMQNRWVRKRDDGVKRPWLGHRRVEDPQRDYDKELALAIGERGFMEVDRRVPQQILDALPLGYVAVADDAENILVCDEARTLGFVITKNRLDAGPIEDEHLRDMMKTLQEEVRKRAN